MPEIGDDMRMAQLEGHLRHWDYEVDAAKKTLARAEHNRERARRDLEAYERLESAE